MSDNRGRAWAFVGYPEDSLPENYLSIVNSWHIPTLISPVHDRDLNADNTEKKKHIHFLLTFDGVKSEQQINFYAKQLNASFAIKVDNVPGMIRYFIHYDNPEKATYNLSDLVAISGFDYSNAFDTRANDVKMMNLVETIINDYNISNFYLLIQTIKALNYIDLYNWLQFHTNTYLKFYLQQKFLYDNRLKYEDKKSTKKKNS